MTFFPDRRLAGLAATALVHLLLIGIWMLARHTPPAPAQAAQRLIQWVRIAPEQPKPRAPQPPPLVHQAVRPAPLAPARPVVSAAVPAEATPPDAAPAPAPAAPSVAELRERAKASIGKIYQDMSRDVLSRDNPRQGIAAPADTPQTRLAKGFAAAADAAPNRWFEAPKVTEILDPGPYGRRRYRVVGALGTYCITIESNHGPDGQDIIKNGIKPKITNCEKNEQAPSSQKWSSAGVN